MTALDAVAWAAGREVEAERWAHRLYERTEREQWSVRTHIHWDAFRVPDFPVSIRRAMAPIYSHVQLGELVTLKLVARVLDRAPEPWAKMIAAGQVNDEARHAEFFGQLVLRLGGPTDIRAPMKEFFATLESLEEPNELLLGSQVILEGFAKCLFEEGAALGRRAAGQRVRLPGRPEPERLLSVISELIGRDESRHVAFGVLYLKRAFQRLSGAESNRLLDLSERLGCMLAAALSDMSGDFSRVGLSTATLLEHVQRAHRNQMRRIGFDV